MSEEPIPPGSSISDPTQHTRLMEEDKETELAKEFEVSSDEENKFITEVRRSIGSRTIGRRGKYTWEGDGMRILHSCGSRMLSSKERNVLAHLVKQGCPVEYRAMLWANASGARNMMSIYPGYYQSLVKDFITYPNPCFSQIELDLNRTFTENIVLKGRIGELRNVLCAYVKRNPTVGYCQGLNFVVAHMLRYLSEEEAFWILCLLIECILPIDYYSIMVGVLIDQQLFKKMMKVTMPHVWGLFKRVGLDPSLVSLQWFVCLYSHNLQSDVSDEIWDNLLVLGSKVLFKAGLAIMTLIERNLIRCGEFHEVFTVLENAPKSLADVNALTQTMHLDKFSFITNYFVNDKRYKRRFSTFESLQKGKVKERSSRQNRKMEAKYRYISRLLLYNSQLKNASTISYDKGNDYLSHAQLLACDVEWPLCLYDHTYKSRCVSYFAFRSRSDTSFIDNHFGEAPRADPSELDPAGLKKRDRLWDESKDAYESLVVERNPHYCMNEKFVQKVNKLLEQKGNAVGAFPSILVDPGSSDESELINVMEQYIDHVIELEVDDNLGECREVQVDTEEGERPMVRQRSLSGGEEEEKPEKPEPKPKRVAAQFSRTICGPKEDAMMNRYGRKAIPISYFLANVASKMPMENREEIIDKSPSGQFLKSVLGQYNI